MGTSALTTSVFVARQPIFHRAKNVHGYELLFRSGRENRYDGRDGDASTRDVIAASFVDIGLDELTGGQRGFVNFTRNLLLEDMADLLPPDLITVEILENVDPDEEIIRACQRLKDAGYTLALDDFVVADINHPLLDLADIVKVDFAATSPEDRKRLADFLCGRHIKPLAEKVETEEDFQQAEADGYHYFQGYFFSKPIIHEGKSIAGNKLAHLRLLEQVNRPEMSLDQIETVIKQDIPLTYKLLRFMNSVWFGTRYKVSSIKRALVMLGPKEIRKWFALISLREMGADKPNELFVHGMIRAKMSEGIAPLSGMAKHASELFLMGMFSVMDALLDAPMVDVLSKLPLDENVKAALLGQDSPFRPVYDLVSTYELGQWDRFCDHATRLKVDLATVPPIFGESLKWANQAFASVNQD
ncbi:MAG: HDOD domain-containing protein [Planctomycetes bacterium]|nr:HDOD domain-containing protein [Planctomycetota bacterium]